MTYYVENRKMDILEINCSERVRQSLVSIESLVKLMTDSKTNFSGDFYYYTSVGENDRTIEEMGEDAYITFNFENVSLKGPVFNWSISFGVGGYFILYLSLDNENKIVYPGAIQTSTMGLNPLNFTNEEELVNAIVKFMEST